MNIREDDPKRLLGLLFASHPWHVLAIGPLVPAVCTVFVELATATR